MNEVKMMLLDNFDKSLKTPSYETKDAAGADIRACLDGENLVIKPFERVLIPTGLAFEIPSGYEIQVRPRSGLSLKTGLMVVNSPGTVDADYRGELKVIMANISDKNEIINHGDRVAQLVFSPVTQARFLQAESLSVTERGTGGFGSTGKN